VSARAWNRLAWVALAAWGAFVLLEGRARRAARELELEPERVYDVHARRNGHDDDAGGRDRERELEIDLEELNRP
jgi:hypothetical protein